jgi:hypothetical protein
VNESITTALLVSFAIGVGVGSLLCERMSGHRIELGLVPFGSIGLSLFAIDLYFAQPAEAVVTVTSIGEFVSRPGSWRILADVLLLGAFGGIYSVPLYALMQQRAERKYLSRIIAANNIMNALFMVAASLLSIAVLGAGFSIPELFIVLALLNAAVAIYIYTLLPEFLMRFLAWILVNTIYRVRPSGTENVPDEGPAVVVCNHVSYMDPILLSASIRRPMRFVMYYKIFQLPLLRFLFQQAKAIPIASANEDEQLMNERSRKWMPSWRPEMSFASFRKALLPATARFSDSGPASSKSSPTVPCRSYRSPCRTCGGAGSAAASAAAFARFRAACLRGSRSSSASP